MLDVQKKASMQYVDFWKSALVQKDVAEKAELQASEVRYMANVEKKIAADKLWMEQYALRLAEKREVDAISGGSGGYGSMPGAAGGGRGGGVSMGAQGALMGAMGETDAGGAVKGAAKGFGLFYAFYKLSHWIEELISGGNPFKGLRGIGPAVGKVGKFFTAFAEVIGTVATFAITAWELTKLGKAAISADQAHAEEQRSAIRLAQQTGHLEVLREETLERQKQEKLVEDAEKKAAAAEDYAARMAESKAEHEKEALAALKEQEKLNKLYGDAAKIRIDAAKVEKEVPTIEMLAGRGYMGDLNKAYGAGGQFDLEAGNGPGAQLAQQYELTKKQQMWDMVHGNFGQAAQDRQKQIGLANQLGAFGLDTPAMKFDAMKEHLNKIQTDISAIARGATLNVAVSDAPATASAKEL